MDAKIFTDLYLAKLNRDLTLEQVCNEIQNSKELNQRDKDTLISMLKNVGQLSYYDFLVLLDLMIQDAKPIPMGDILQIDLSINLSSKAFILFLMDKYKCKKVFKRGSDKNVKTRSEIENLKK